jgi:hypothetical protein
MDPRSGLLPAPAVLVLAAGAFLPASPHAVHASPLKLDEEVLFFRSVAPVPPRASSWTVPVRAWVFEPERSSITRRLLLKALAKALRLPAGSETDATFRGRAELFLADSEGGKDLSVRIGTVTRSLPRSGSDGLVTAALAVPAFPVGDRGLPAWLRYSLALPAGDARRFEGQTHLVPSGGSLGVVSDIDDTVKVTVVRDRKETLANTFLRPFKAVDGMAGAYSRWAGAGAVFHYVSGSPWQLYPSIVRFLDESGFPAGALHLRPLWRRGHALPEFSISPEQHKIPEIEAILAAHGERAFALVGDSGEKDPEIYGEIARRHPGRIKRILIRRAPLADERPERYEAAFRGLPQGLWAVFSDPPRELPGDL